MSYFSWPIYYKRNFHQENESKIINDKDNKKTLVKVLYLQMGGIIAYVTLWISYMVKTDAFRTYMDSMLKKYNGDYEQLSKVVPYKNAEYNLIYYLGDVMSHESILRFQSIYVRMLSITSIIIITVTILTFLQMKKLPGTLKFIHDIKWFVIIIMLIPALMLIVFFELFPFIIMVSLPSWPLLLVGSILEIIVITKIIRFLRKGRLKIK